MILLTLFHDLSTFHSIIYIGFRVHLHQRSLVPIWNYFWWLWWPMISGDGWGLNFPDICHSVEEKSQKNWSNRGTNPGSLGERQQCYSLTTAVVIFFDIGNHISLNSQTTTDINFISIGIFHFSKILLIEGSREKNM